MNADRIVITGMGLVSPLGCGVEQVWQRLIRGDSGITTIDRFDTSELPVKIAGLVPDIAHDSEAGLDQENLVPVKDRKKLALFTIYALAAAKEALTQAKWFPDTESDRRATATIIGTGIGGFPIITNGQKTLTSRGYKKISPFIVPAFLANLAAGNVSIKYGFKGPLGTPVTACAAGVQAIGDGMRLIKSGEANIALVGGTDACVDPLSLAGFNALKALSTNNENPSKASRPFDRNRDGFVLGEGAGLLVIESMQHAIARGAKPLAEIAGYGTSSDAYHITSGPADGSGSAQAIQTAINMAKTPISDIHYINAHATSTPVGDSAEIASLKSVFADHLKHIAISSTKSATGHLLGAAGGIESIFTALSVMHNMLPPTLNFQQADDAMAGLDFVPQARSANVSNALCNGFGFGGVNASLLIRKYTD